MLELIVATEHTEHGQQDLMFGKTRDTFDLYLKGLFPSKDYPYDSSLSFSSFVEIQDALNSLKHADLETRRNTRGCLIAPSNITSRILHQARYGSREGPKELVKELQEIAQTTLILTSSILVERIGDKESGGYLNLVKRYQIKIDELLKAGKITRDSALLVHFAYITPTGKISSWRDKNYIIEKMPKVAQAEERNQTWIYRLNETDEQGRPNPKGKDEVDTFLSYVTGFPVEVLPKISDINGLSLGKCTITKEGAGNIREILFTIPRTDDERPSIILSSAGYYPAVGILMKPYIFGVRARNSFWAPTHALLDKSAKRPVICC